MQTVGNYLVSDQHYLYIAELQTCYVAVTVVGQRSGRIDKLMLDTTSLAVKQTSDVDTLRASRRDPVQSKIDLALRNRLLNMKAGETIQVAVWFKTPAGEDIASRQQRAFDYLVKTYPAAAESMRKYGKPLGVDNSSTSQFIQGEYERLMGDTANTTEIKATTQLAAKGIVVRAMRPMPAIVAHLSPQQIAEFAADDGVDMIYLNEEESRPALLDAAGTHALLPVWASGITGAGQTIAIIEAGNVQRNNSYLNYEPVYLVSVNGPIEHATRVAAAAASFYDAAPGSGRGARILSAGGSTSQDDEIYNLQWVTSNPQNARIVNHSDVVCSGTTIALVTRGFDYWARQNNAFVTAAAGNDGGGYVCSPANGYNVLGVGSINNQNTPDWSDDVMSSFSSWQNPTSAHSDREKPEVVAVGEHLTMWGANNTLENDQLGTSLSAPQVAGLGALLLNKNPALSLWPEASRAIVMASAIHNIEGSPRLTPTVDIHDGVGAIVADQAIAVAALRGSSSTPCYVSCWWGESMSGTPRGGTLARTFYAGAGQHVRAAIAWWATADSAPYNTETLDTDLDLKVRNPSGNYFANSISGSYDNNYELVDFIAPDTGVYTLEVYKSYLTSPSDPGNTVGIALVTTRYSVYLPAIMN